MYRTRLYGKHRKRKALMPSACRLEFANAATEENKLGFFGT
uniref:Uncharacterized protein n=1 Tax=Rhizobium rhizogenes TaxID=359 RepID=A0A7S4ZS92_RHIRH|nr:hypothetical protein pC5.7b_300 [Rhizobium rhizogenes]